MSSLDSAIAVRKRGFPPRRGRRGGDRRETADGPPPPAPAENSPSVSCPAAAGTRETGRIPDGLDRSSERGAGAPGAGPAAEPDPTCRDPLAARFRVRRTGPRTGPDRLARGLQTPGVTGRTHRSGRVARARHAPWHACRRAPARMWRSPAVGAGHGSDPRSRSGAATTSSRSRLSPIPACPPSAHGPPPARSPGAGRDRRCSRSHETAGASSRRGRAGTRVHGGCPPPT